MKWKWPWAKKAAPPLPTELYIFGFIGDARVAGFHPHSRRHSKHPHMRAWIITDDPEAIRGLELGRVFLMPDVRRRAIQTRRAPVLNRALDNAKAGLRVEPMIWMEL